MSFINKVKNFFYEDIEEDDEEFESREALKREERLRKKEEKERRRFEEQQEKKPIVQQANNDLSERELFKSERTFNFPMDLGDDIFDITETMPLDLDEKKEESRSQIKEEKNLYARPTRTVTPTTTRPVYASEQKTEEQKKFRPSPVVSPVYGILDKDYTVEDVVEKTLSKTKEFSLEKKSVDFDTVRNRAYKELDEEIEKTLTGQKDIFYNLEEEVKEENTGEIEDYIEDSYDKNENKEDDVIITYEGTEEFKEEKKEFEEPVQEEISEPEEDEEESFTPDVAIPTVEKKEKKTRRSKKVDDEEEYDEEKEDLFNLIDNMYNDEDEEEEED